MTHYSERASLNGRLAFSREARSHVYMWLQLSMLVGASERCRCVLVDFTVYERKDVQGFQGCAYVDSIPSKV